MTVTIISSGEELANQNVSVNDELLVEIGGEAVNAVLTSGGTESSRRAAATWAVSSTTAARKSSMAVRPPR
jgi:hypothetical protein